MATKEDTGMGGKTTMDCMETVEVDGMTMKTMKLVTGTNGMPRVGMMMLAGTMTDGEGMQIRTCLMRLLVGCDRSVVYSVLFSRRVV